MFFKKFIFTCLYLNVALGFAEVPPQDIPSSLFSQFTLDGAIPVQSWYLNNSYSSNTPLLYTKEAIQTGIEQALKKKTNYYGDTDTYLYSAFDKYRSSVQDKSVAVLGSVIPWYESIVIAYGGNPTTIEYNKIISLDPRLEAMTVEEYDAHPKQFDALISISSFEHDGLGRYGDPINPCGDLKAMQRAKEMLKEDGLLFLAVPVGQDCLTWNAHRIYGKIRLKLLFTGWTVVTSFGFNERDFQRPLGNAGHQPVFVLKPIR